MVKGNSVEHFSFFMNKLITDERFCVIRPSDGEYLVLIGTDFSNIDNWHFNGTGSLKDDLSNAIMEAALDPDTYIGIPSQGDSVDIYNYYKSRYNLKETTES